MAAVAEISGETVTAITTTATATAAAKNAKLEESKADFQREVENLVDILSKLNPLAEEFVPSSYHHVSSLDRQQQQHRHHQQVHDQWPMMMMMQQQQLQQQQQQRRRAHFFSPDNKPPPPFGGNDGGAAGFNPNNRRRRTNYNHQGRRRFNGRAFRAQREDSIRRTVYVSDIDQLVTEEQLAGVFSTCGQVVDCRVCGDPHSVLRFAFVEFADEHGARAALRLGGTMLGYYPVRVLPSKTAILPVNSTFLPRSEDEREMCARTVYCTNIDKKVSQDELSNFFETACGEVSRLRLLGDHVHSTRIAFVEFAMAESAIMALNCSGMVVGSQPIRVSPSKTPIRPRVSRTPSQ